MVLWWCLFCSLVFFKGVARTYIGGVCVCLESTDVDVGVWVGRFDGPDLDDTLDDCWEPIWKQ